MKKFILTAVFCAPIFAQPDVRDVLNAKLSAAAASTNAVTVVASQGDGASCSIVKQANGKIAANVVCVASDGKTSLTSAVLRSNGTQTTPLLVDFGDICGLVVVNPTASVATVGSVGAVPANGIAWQFSTNVRVAGAVTGQTPLVSGSIVWP